MADIPDIVADIQHVYHAFFQCLSNIISDVLRKNVGHGVQNVGHVWMSDDFSYTLRLDRRDVHLEMLKMYD